MIDPNKSEQNQESPTAIEYQFQNDLMRLLSTEVYNVNGVRKKYQEPSEIQAMLWGLQRYEGGTNPTNEGSYASAEALAQEQILGMVLLHMNLQQHLQVQMHVDTSLMQVVNCCLQQTLQMVVVQNTMTGTLY